MTAAAETPQSTWPDVLRYADAIGEGDNARAKWSKERKVPNRWRPAIASKALDEGRHVPDRFFSVITYKRYPQTKGVKK